MPSSRSSPTVAFLPPPGPAAQDFRTLPTGQVKYSPSSTADRAPPRLFRDALSIRAAVFVLEQHCSGAEEVDADDGVSWHWVIFAEMPNEGHQASRGDGESGSDVDDDSIVGEGKKTPGSDRPAEDSGEEEDTISGERPAATIRLVPAQAHADADDEKAVEGPDYKGSRVWDHSEPYVKLGRLATVAACRGRGYGKMLVDTALGFARKNRGKVVRDRGLGEWKGLVLVHAQKRVEGWYKSLGFELDEGMGWWWEEGIEHVAMWKRVEELGE